MNKISVIAIGWLMVSSAWGFESLLPPMNGQADDFAERRAGKAVDATIRIGVAGDGIYRLGYSALTNAGVAPATLIGSTMRIFCKTQEIAIWVSNDGQWSSTNDYLLFAGKGFDGYYSSTNVYWLGFGPSGKRMLSRSAVPVAGSSLVTSYRKTVLHHVDYSFRESYRPYDASIDHWVDRYVSQYSVESFYTNTPCVTDSVLTNDPVSFDAVLYGWGDDPTAYPNHITRVTINGQALGQYTYNGEVTFPVSSSFPASWLTTTNRIGLKQMVNGNDYAFLERFSVTYTRSLVQESSALCFKGQSGTNNYRVTGYAGTNGVQVFDVTDPANALRLTGFQTTNMGPSYAVQFGDSRTDQRQYTVCQGTGIKDITAVQRVFFRSLAATNQQADYIVICPYAFRDQVYRLLKMRYAQGLSVTVAPLPDIYNQFSYGIADADAIKQFIGYAFHHWKTPPKYVLIAGIGTYNPRYYPEAFSPLLPDVVPVHLGSGVEEWTALDGWYATVNGQDCVPDVVVGRIPVADTSQLKNVVDKMIAFEAVPMSDPRRTEALFVADEYDYANGLDFTAASEGIRTSFLDPNNYWTTSDYKDYVSGGSAAVVKEINKGKFIVNFFGHGWLNFWSKNPPNQFDTNSVNSLTNNFYPVMSMLTCLNGAFHGTSVTNKAGNVECLAKLMLKSNRGAVACIAASGLGTLYGGQNLAAGLYDAMLTQKKKRLGDAMLPAYTALYAGSGDTSELMFYELLGDPAMMINP